MPIGMIVTVPIFLNGLGAEVYGVYIFIGSVIGINALFNLGFGDTAVKYISHYLEIKKIEAAKETHRTIIFCSIISGFLAFIIIFLNISNIKIAFDIENIFQIDSILLLSSIILPLKLLEAVYVSTIRGIGNYELAARITIISKIANLLIMVACVYLGFNLLGMILSTLITCLCSLLALYFFTYKFFKSSILPYFNLNSFRKIYNFSVWSWIQGLSGIVYSNFDKFVLSFFFGMKLLALYGVCLQIAQNLHSIYTAASHTIFPLVSRTSARFGAGKETLKIFKFTDSAIVLVASIPAAFICFYSYDILNIWVGSDIAISSYEALSILILVFCLFSINSISTFYILNGIGKVKLQTFISFFAAVIMVVSSLLFIPSYGLLGAALCRLPDSIIRIFIKIYSANSILKIKEVRYAFDFIFLILINFSIIFLLEFIVSVIFQQILISNLTKLLLIFIIYSMLTLSIGYKYQRTFSNWSSIKDLIKSKEFKIS